jgi:hypothetical protein
MIKELDVVTLTRDLENPPLVKGSRGAVVHCYADGEGFEVEFIDGEAQKSTVVTLESTDIQLESQDVHAQILTLLGALSPDRLAEVRDFAEFLHQQQLNPRDRSTPI